MTENPLESAAPADFDLDAWIDGTCGLTRTARIYQRGDLLAVLSKLEDEIEVAKKVPKDDRGVDDKSPEQLQQEWDAAAEEMMQSSMIVHVQDRTTERRQGIAEGLKKKGLKLDKQEDMDTINLHLLADAIVKIESHDGKVRDMPGGFPVEKLRNLKERLGDAAIIDAWNAFTKVTQEAPTVAAPLSRRFSSGRGGIT
jgi:hypothetical protein